VYKVILALIALSTATSAYAAPDYEACTKAFHTSTVAWKEIMADNEVRQVIRDAGTPLSPDVTRHYVDVLDRQISYLRTNLESLTYLRDHYECTSGDNGALDKVIKDIRMMENGVSNLNYTRSLLSAN
jgi:hypothetical protein